MTKHSYKRIEPVHKRGYHSATINNRINTIWRYIVRCVRAYDTMPTCADIIEYTGLSRYNVDYALSLLCLSGRLRKTGYGAYEVVIQNSEV